MSDPQTNLSAEAFDVEDPLLDNGGRLMSEEEVRKRAVHEAEVWLEEDKAPGEQRKEEEEKVMTTLTPEQIVKISGNIEVLQSEIAEREEAIVNMKAKLAEAQGLGEHLVGDYKITAYVSKQFQAGLAEKVLPADRWEAISVPARTTSAALAKKVLSDEEYARCQKVSDKVSVKIERRED